MQYKTSKKKKMYVWNPTNKIVVKKDYYYY